MEPDIEIKEKSKEPSKESQLHNFSKSSFLAKNPIHFNEVIALAKVDQILWPKGFEPENCPIHVRNEISVASSPQNVWMWLVRAQLWPTWYPNSDNIKFLNGKSPDLAVNTTFQWKTFGITIKSTVREFVPFERLAWDARGAGLTAYHAWLIQSKNEGTHIITEETEKGWFARLGKVLRPKRVEQIHQVWLERLAEKAMTGLPPATIP